MKLYFSAQGHSNGTNQDSRSEATSVCGDNSSVLSGFSGAVQSNTVATSKQAAVNASVAEQVSKMLDLQRRETFHPHHYGKPSIA